MRLLAPYKTAIAHVLGRFRWLGTSLPQHGQRGGHSALLQRRAPRRWTQAATYASSSIKKSIIYKCTSCGETTTQWKGRCPSCAGWNTCDAVSLSQHASCGGSWCMHGRHARGEPIARHDRLQPTAMHPVFL